MINSNYKHYSPSFQAKFLDSKSLRLIAEYAVEHGKFDKLNQARKNIDVRNLQTRLRVDIGVNDDKPFVSFTRFEPKDNVIIPKSLDDFKTEKVTVYQSDKKCNPLKFALEKLIKLGNGVPNSKMYQSVVFKKD